MNRKIGTRVIAATIVVITIFALGPTAHAQNFNLYTRADRASYVPGDSGTLTVTIVNTGSSVIQLNNLTVYFPWAGFDSNGKWQGNSTASYSNTFIGAPGGTTSTTFTTSFQFTIPTWYGGSFIGFSGNCNGSSSTRYVQQNSCVVVGSNQGNRYELMPFTGGIPEALPTYTPVSIVSQAIPIATLVVLVVATAFLALVWTSNRRVLAKK